MLQVLSQQKASSAMSMSRTSGSKKTEHGGLEDLAGRWRVRALYSEGGDQLLIMRTSVTVCVCVCVCGVQVSDVPPEARAELLPMEEEEASRELRGWVTGGRRWSLGHGRAPLVALTVTEPTSVQA